MFVKFIDNRVRKAKCLIVHKNFIYISQYAYKAIGKPKNVEIYYDTEANAIQLKISDKSGKKVTERRFGQAQITCLLSNIMPIGRYNLQDNIFILNKLV
jgi:hypothetical protein